ncbi:hypothetical protein CapIbe_007595 [Capra ibex]
MQARAHLLQHDLSSKDLKTKKVTYSQWTSEEGDGMEAALNYCIILEGSIYIFSSSVQLLTEDTTVIHIFQMGEMTNLLTHSSKWCRPYLNLDLLN